jgi:hypothetical protein
MEPDKGVDPRVRAILWVALIVMGLALVLIVWFAWQGILSAVCNLALLILLPSICPDWDGCACRDLRLESAYLDLISDGRLDYRLMNRTRRSRLPDRHQSAGMSKPPSFLSFC